MRSFIDCFICMSVVFQQIILHDFIESKSQSYAIPACCGGSISLCSYSFGSKNSSD